MAQISTKEHSQDLPMEQPTLHVRSKHAVWSEPAAKRYIGYEP